jgi:branched-chain amino acid aminotransferase
MTVLINGEPTDGRLDVLDSAVIRGDGCFESIRVYDGEPFQAERHLARLERSAGMLDLSLPDLGEIAGWVRQVAGGHHRALVRVIVTRGSIVGDGPRGRVIVLDHLFEPPTGPARLLPVAAPWHPGGVDWRLAGAKTLSYAPNLSAARAARESGFDDALLVSRQGALLEGTTFSVAWVAEGALETPSLGLGILDSITRQLVIEDATMAGLNVVEGEWGADRLVEATEMIAMSTVREVQGVAVVGELEFPIGKVTALLQDRFAHRIGNAVSGQESTAMTPSQSTRR